MKRLLIVLLTAALLAGAVSNSGTRHETALSLSEEALAYYTGEYAPEALSALAGSASGRSDEAWASPLRAALGQLMTQTRSGGVSYAAALAAFSNTDCSGGSQEPLRFYCDDFGTVNREELWAEAHGSYWHEGPGCDLHHLRPANPQANLARGSMCFGRVRERFSDYKVWPEEGEPVFWYKADWNSGAGLVEPRDEIKGDVARILLYVWTCWGEAGGGNLNLWTELPASGVGLEASDGKPVIEDADTLLDWMALDPVDSWELGRNDAVQAIQGNRNVFIDYPELAFLLLDREIPDMPSPSGWARSSHCSLELTAEPPEGGTVSLSPGPCGSYTVSASPRSGWELSGWSLSPENAAVLVRSGGEFRLSGLREDCELHLYFTQKDPCADGHSWDGGLQTAAPGCETAGERRYTCTRCGAVKTEPVPALGHAWEGQNISPGCVRPGIYLEYCPRCGAERETPTEPPLGHAWDSGTVTRPATQDQPGERSYRCLRCGLTRREEIPFRFLDVSDEGAYYFVPVYWALHHQPRITAGTGPTLFSPHQPCTRAQVMCFLWSACGRPEPAETPLPFTDVPEGAWYRKAVLWALEREITAGTGPDRFSPHRVCTRSQTVCFLWHALGDPEPPEGESLPFADVPPDAYYRRALAWAVDRGVVSGTGAESFSPGASCTRAQVVTMLWRAFGP